MRQAAGIFSSGLGIAVSLSPACPAALDLHTQVGGQLCAGRRAAVGGRRWRWEDTHPAAPGSGTGQGRPPGRGALLAAIEL